MAVETDGFTNLDSFTNGPGTWANMSVASGVANPASLNIESGARRISTFGANQYSQIDVTEATGTAPWVYVMVRMASTTDGDCYAVGLDIENTDMFIYEVVDSGSLAFNQIGTGQGITLSLPDTVYISASGTTTTTLTIKFNGGSSYSQNDTTSPLTTGQPGFGAYMFSGYATSFDLDNWEGGDLAGGPYTGSYAGSMSVAGAAPTRRLDMWRTKTGEL